MKRRNVARILLCSTVAGLTMSTMVPAASATAPSPSDGSYFTLIHKPFRCELNTVHPGIVFDFNASIAHPRADKQYIIADFQLQTFNSDVTGGADTWRNYAKRTWRSVDYTRTTKYPTKARAAVRFAVNSPDEVTGQRLRAVIHVRWRKDRRGPDSSFWESTFTTAEKTCVSGWDDPGNAPPARTALAGSTRGPLSSLPEELQPESCVPGANSGESSAEESESGRLDTNTDWELLTVSGGTDPVSLSDIRWRPADGVQSFPGSTTLQVGKHKCARIGALSDLRAVTLTDTSTVGDNEPDAESWSFSSQSRTNFLVARSMYSGNADYFQTQRVISEIFPFVSASCPTKNCLLLGDARVLEITPSGTVKTLAESSVRVPLGNGKTRFRWPLSDKMKRVIHARLGDGVFVDFSGTIGSTQFRDFVDFRS